MKPFCELAIGATFEEHKKATRPVDCDTRRVFRKVSRSQAQCIGQEGYGNTRAVGGVYNYAPYSRVKETH